MILLEDPDAPLARPVIHLIAANIPASIHHLEAGMLNASSGVAPVRATLSTVSDTLGGDRSSATVLTAISFRY
jgi:phosphatidylethanolamine-binding protein (PEBP) family uncharacterized protein